jgi:hypothetical protein
MNTRRGRSGVKQADFTDHFTGLKLGQMLGLRRLKVHAQASVQNKVEGLQVIVLPEKAIARLHFFWTPMVKQPFQICIIQNS